MTSSSTTWWSAKARTRARERGTSEPSAPCNGRTTYSMGAPKHAATPSTWMGTASATESRRYAGHCDIVCDIACNIVCDITYDIVCDIPSDAGYGGRTASLWSRPFPTTRTQCHSSTYSETLTSRATGSSGMPGHSSSSPARCAPRMNRTTPVGIQHWTWSSSLRLSRSR